jgi:hypothetical protein
VSAFQRAASMAVAAAHLAALDLLAQRCEAVLAPSKVQDRISLGADMVELQHDDVTLATIGAG